MKKHVHPLTILPAFAMLASGTAFAQGDLAPNDQYGINVGPARISPFVSVAGFYDSNPDYVRDGEKNGRFGTSKDYDSWGYRVHPGIDLKWPANDWSLVANGWYSMERYEQDFIEDRDSYGESAQLSIEAPRELTVKVSESYKFISESDDENHRWDDRADFATGLDIAKALGEKTSVGLGAGYRFVDYDAPQLNDWSKVTLRARLARAITDKMDATLHGAFETDDSDHQHGNAETWTVTGGIASRATEKITYGLGAGAHFYSGFEGASDKTKLAYHAKVNWEATEKFSMSLSGNSSFYPAEDEFDSSIYEAKVSLGARYRPVSRWLLTAHLSFYRDEYDGEVSTGTATIMNRPNIVGRHRVDSYYAASLGASYALTKFASLNGRFLYSFDDSTVSEYDYDRWRAMLGVTLRY